MTKYFYNELEIVAPLSIISNEPHFDMTTISLKNQRQSQGHQRWELSFNLMPSKGQTDTDLLLSTFVDFDSPATMIMPQLVANSKIDINDPSPENRIIEQGSAPYASLYPYVSSTFNVGINTISILRNGKTAVGANTTNISGKLKKGTFIKFSNHDKIYILRDEVNLNTTAASSIKIHPPLRNQITGTTQVMHSNRAILTYLVDIDNQQGITYQDGILSNAGTIRIFERL